MSHYFTSPDGPQKQREIRASIWGRDYTFTTANGVFSGMRLDPGTATLFRETEPPQRPGRFADIGCGFGPIALALATECPGAVVDAVDVNDRALALTRLNAENLGVVDRVRVLRPEDVGRDAQSGQRYDQLWSNPPIRIGKPALHALLLEWLPRLAPGGQAWMVVSKNLGADSLQQWIGAQGWSCERAASSKGFRILHVEG